MDFAEIKTMGERERRELLAEKRAELRTLRFQVSGNQLKNVRAIRAAKKMIARILTREAQV